MEISPSAVFAILGMLLTLLGVVGRLAFSAGRSEQKQDDMALNIGASMAQLTTKIDALARGQESLATGQEEIRRSAMATTVEFREDMRRLEEQMQKLTDLVAQHGDLLAAQDGRIGVLESRPRPTTRR